MAPGVASDLVGSDIDDQVLIQQADAEAAGLPAPQDQTDKRMVRVVAGLFLTAMAARSWIPDLTSGWRLDENLTAWIVSDGFDDAVSRSWNHQGQSPVYFAALWIWSQVAGSSVVALRLPSVVAGIATAWHLRALGSTLDRRVTGELAAVLVFGFSTGLVDARPYSMLLLALVIAARFGHAWSTSPRSWLGVGWVVFAALAIAMHPFAVYGLLAQAIFLVVGLRAHRTAREAIGLVGLGAVLIAPLVPQWLSLSDRSAGLVLVDLPNGGDLVAGLMPVPVGAAAIAGVLWSRRHWTGTPWTSTAAWFVAMWAVVPVLGLFAQSYVSGDSVFISYYHSPSLPGLALMVAGLTVRATRPRSTTVVLATFALVAVLLTGPTPSHDWRTSVEVADAAPHPTRVWTMSAYIEASDASVFADAGSRAYLNAPFTLAGAGDDLYGLPLNLDTEVNRQYVAALVDDALATQSNVVIIQRNDKRYDGANEAARMLREAGFVETDRHFPAGLTVTVLGRKG